MQQEIVKDYIMLNTKTRVGKVKLDNVEYIAFITDNGARLRLIPENVCVLSYDKMVKRFGEVDAGRVWRTCAQKAQTPAKMSGIMRKSRNGKGVDAELVGGLESVWINPKLLDTFDAATEFLVGGKTDAIVVLERELPAGMILPLNTKEDK